MIDSLTLAQRFNKNHYDVMRAIRDLRCSKEFHKENFKLEYRDVDRKGYGVKQEPYYKLTPDAMKLLVFGFRGKKAMEFKEAYLMKQRELKAEIMDSLDVMI